MRKQDLRRFTTQIEVNNSYEAECIERKLEKIITQKEPIDKTAPLMYTERRDGVRPETDIRTDRWEIATQAMGVVNKTNIAKRDNKGKSDGKPEPTVA